MKTLKIVEGENSFQLIADGTPIVLKGVCSYEVKRVAGEASLVTITFIAGTVEVERKEK